MASQWLKTLPFVVALALGGMAQAQTPVTTQSNASVIIENLDWVDKSRMDKEWNTINQYAQSKIGRQFNDTLQDLEVIQQLIDRGHIKNDDQERQAALGLVMGRVYLADFPLTLEWKVYRDQLGRSRALCVKGTQECIFPITLLIRRMQVGTRPDVTKIYYDTVEGMAQHLPKVPYGEGVLHRLKPAE